MEFKVNVTFKILRQKFWLETLNFKVLTLKPKTHNLQQIRIKNRHSITIHGQIMNLIFLSAFSDENQEFIVWWWFMNSSFVHIQILRKYSIECRECQYSI